MSLAAIILLCFWSPVWLQQPSSGAPPDLTAPQTQSPPAAPTSAGQTGESQSSGQTNPSAAKKRKHKTKPDEPDCTTPTATTPAPSNAADPAATPSATTATAPKPCPPAKVVIRNGGADEPAITLTGGSKEKASYEKASTDQLLASAEENIKKIAGRHLNVSQQDMMTQARQFMEQSKAAVSAGDLERGHKLAVKAHLLTDELVKP